MTYFDDNFGAWDMGETAEDREDTMRFYEQVQRESVPKTCAGCGRRVRLRPDYAYCNDCADARERGYDI